MLDALSCLWQTEAVSNMKEAWRIWLPLLDEKSFLLFERQRRWQSGCAPASAFIALQKSAVQHGYFSLTSEELCKWWLSTSMDKVPGVWVFMSNTCSFPRGFQFLLGRAPALLPYQQLPLSKACLSLVGVMLWEIVHGTTHLLLLLCGCSWSSSFRFSVFMRQGLLDQTVTSSLM